MIDGICYEFVEFLPDATVEDLTVQGTFTSCSNCIDPDNSSSSSSVVVSFPASCVGCGQLGDVHWVWGNDLITNGPDMASFNVDDNAGTNEIVWFTFLEGATEYAIKYTQQEFAYTVGGKSINQITITETGQSDIVYSLTANQDGFLKDGIGFPGSETFSLGDNVCTVSITSKTIDTTSNCCIKPGDFFSLLQMDIQFKDGLYYTDEVGGALYYIWKKARTEGPGAVNNPSNAGLDGLGSYLGGTRSDWEAAPNTLRESTDSTILAEISDRMTELNGINGTVDFDWDPLAQDPPVCQMETCGVPNANPTIYITMSWTDVDVTKNYLGCSWCNGETKEIYVGTYTLYYNTTTTSTQETWGVSNSANDRIFLKAQNGGGAYSKAIRVVHPDEPMSLYASNIANVFYNHPVVNVGSDNINEYAFDPFSGRIDSAQFGFVTSSAGITITWIQGSGW
jgi:hypothetical protein